jgi:hypothetical protein
MSESMESPANGEVLLPDEEASYIEQMLAKADGTAPPKEETEKAKTFAGKFKSVEELERAYGELQAKLGQRAPEAKPAEAPKDGAAASMAEAKAAVQEAGLDFSALEREYREGGDLSAQSRAALQAKGIGKAMVDAFLAGQQAAETLGRQKVFEAVGGEQTYRAMMAWAATTLSQEEVDAYNDVARGSNLAALRMAAAGLYARYEASEGSEPKLVTASGARPTEDTYTSWAQVRADMSDRRYERDEAFRRGVEAKLGRSRI